MPEHEGSREAEVQAKMDEIALFYAPEHQDFVKGILRKFFPGLPEGRQAQILEEERFTQTTRMNLQPERLRYSDPSHLAIALDPIGSSRDATGRVKRVVQAPRRGYMPSLEVRDNPPGPSTLQKSRRKATTVEGRHAGRNELWKLKK